MAPADEFIDKEAPEEAASEDGDELPEDEAEASDSGSDSSEEGSDGEVRAGPASSL